MAPPTQRRKCVCVCVCVVTGSMYLGCKVVGSYVCVCVCVGGEGGGGGERDTEK